MCFLFVYSDTESFKAFAKGTQIPVYSVYDQDDQMEGDSDKQKDYRISFDVSEADWDEIEQQKIDAIKFLTDHMEALKKFFERTDITSAVLDFPLSSRLSDEIIMMEVKCPAKLIRLAAKLNIDIAFSIYNHDAMDDYDGGAACVGQN